MSTTETYTTEEVITKLMEMWFLEHEFANMENINKSGTQPANGG
jgi:hypothetical protein